MNIGDWLGLGVLAIAALLIGIAVACAVSLARGNNVRKD